MENWKENFLFFAKNKVYVLLLSLTAVASYGFMITHHAVGIDDTPYSLYFEEGLAAIVGRWVLFVLNKVVTIGDFAPYLTDLAGVLILMVAVTVWSTLFYTILKDRIPGYGYVFFACVFLSCPLISEVYVYHLHNGVAIGYLCSGISLCFFLEGLKWSKKSLACFAGSLLSLWIALGCYESFMMVWLVGICIILMLKRMCGERVKVFAAIGTAGAVGLCVMVVRSITIAVVTGVFGLEALRDDAVQRSVMELVGWILQEDAMAKFAMVLKRTYLMYVVFGCAYYPIRIFLLATVVILIAAIVYSIRRKDGWIFLLSVAVYVAAFSLIVIEGKETYYRCAQFLPVICGFGVLVCAGGVSAFEKKLISGAKNGTAEVRRRKIAGLSRGVACMMLTVILWNQCADMNKWFYVDWQKYETAKETMQNVAYELERKFDTTKPIVFTGIYEAPVSIIQDAYVSYSSQEYKIMLLMTTWMDEHLLEKFYRSPGVWVVQQPTLSVIEWGKNAFDNNAELTKFFEMHGYHLVPNMDMELYETAEEYSLELPAFPREGSIVDMGEYIIVHF